MFPKRILVPQRLRQPPATGWSWLDRRFLREHGDYLSREAVLLYLFLAAVADRHGLSFYSDHALTSRLRLTQPVLEQARQELLDRDLIARRLHCSRHTVAAALERAQPPAREPARRGSLLDPYLEQIQDLLTRYPDLSAVRIREEIARGPQGYRGSATVLRRYLRRVRP